MKGFWKRAAALVLTASLCLSSPAVAFAATETANNFKELTSIFREHALKRDSSFTVKINASEKEFDEHLLGPEENSLGDFWDGMVSLMDDPNTSDDADYIVGNLNWTKGLLGEVNNNTLEFKPTFFETLPQTEYVNQHVPEILQEIGIPDMSTNYDKVKAIHDWVCKKITYTGSKKDIASTCYGAITDGKVLCNGYALCLYKLLVGAGIPCKYIGGKAGTGRDSNGHAWNIVALGDKWYYVDCTWDDEDTRIIYDYFLKGKKDFDEADPTQYHKLDYGYTTFFAKAFPVADTSFNPTMMDSTNNTVQIGSELPDDLSGTSTGSDDGGGSGQGGNDTKYTKDDVVWFTLPETGYQSVKRNRLVRLDVFLTEEYEDQVKYVSYRIRSGKGNIKKIKNDGFKTNKKYDVTYTQLSLRGKKRGKVKLDVILEMDTGQEIKVPFTVNVR